MDGYEIVFIWSFYQELQINKIVLETRGGFKWNHSYIVIHIFSLLLFYRNVFSHEEDTVAVAIPDDFELADVIQDAIIRIWIVAEIRRIKFSAGVKIVNSDHFVLVADRNEDVPRDFDLVKAFFAVKLLLRLSLFKLVEIEGCHLDVTVD